MLSLCVALAGLALVSVGQIDPDPIEICLPQLTGAGIEDMARHAHLVVPFYRREF